MKQLQSAKSHSALLEMSATESKSKSYRAGFCRANQDERFSHKHLITTEET